MTHPGWALQKAIYAALTADAVLTGLLGGVHIHDGAPRRAVMPFVVLEPVVTKDADSDEAEASEHELGISIWSRAEGKRELFAVSQQIAGTLHDAGLPLDGHRLVNLRLERQDARQLSDHRTWRGDMRFRAVTEPAA